MTYQELADRAETSGPTVHHYLSGRKDPGLRVVRRLAAAVGLDLRAVRSTNRK